MVVDDDEPIHDVLRLTLEDDYDVMSTFSGATAIHALDTRRIDLILLDLLMPSVDGWQVFEHLGAMTQQRPKVIFLTGVDSSVAAVAAVKLGAEDWIVKPFDEGMLRQQIRSLLRPQCIRVQGGDIGMRAAIAVLIAVKHGVFAEYGRGPVEAPTAHDRVSVDVGRASTVSEMAALLNVPLLNLSVHPVVVAAVHHIAKHLPDVNVESLAQGLDLSSNYVLQLFRRELGLTPRDYIARVRVEVIKQRLGQPHCPSFEQLAEEVGLCDASHLSRVFTRYVQTPPGLYRGNIQADS
jgi:YesN/AraC family two-component response regulator